MKKHLGTLLIIAGVVIIAIPLVGRYVAGKKQEALMQTFLEESEAWANEEIYEDLGDALVWGSLEENQEELDSAADVAVLSVENGSEIGNQETNDDAHNNLGTSESIIAKPKTVGLLSIDKIDVYFPVAEGTDQATLKYALGHMPGSATIGEVGNCVIAGHRGHSFGTYFSRLDEMEIGDTIEASQGGVTYTYEVYEKLIVEPDDLSVLKDSSNYQVLTLITCDPMYTSTHRLIIHAVVKDS